MHRFSCFAAAALVAGASTGTALASTSQDVTFLSNHNQHGSYASCWGWTSPGGQELAILGAAAGTAIIDVTVPGAPTEKAFILGVNSLWREMKSYSHYAYVVTEGSNGGMQIIDLATNPPSLVTTYTTTFTTAHTITIVGNYAYVSGAKFGSTQVGVRFLDLTNPVAPVDRGGWNGFYTHDCQVRGNLMYAAGISNGNLSVVDVTNKAAPFIVKTFTWPGNTAHNCDLTVDGRYLLTTDETPGGHLHVFDMLDIQNPVLVAEWQASPDDIIHNVHIRNNLAFIAYYTAGMRVVDITNPSYPIEVGFYDTFPGASGGYNGDWEVYPYAASGNQYISDMVTGLYVVRYEPTSGSLSGIVSESGGGPVLANAQVSILGGGNAATNGSGYYRLFGAPGSQTVLASYFGFETDSSTVDLTVGQDQAHNVQLVRLPGTGVEGTVRNANTQAPLGSASLVLNGSPLLETTDGAGSYDFGSIPYGVYTITASRFGYAPKRQTVTVTAHDGSQSIVSDFALAPAGLSADFEAGPAGWTRVTGSPAATGGLWVWADPVGSGGGGVQPEDDHSANPGALCWVTGNAASPNDGVGTNDIDNGQTILVSPVFDLSGYSNPAISYWRWYTNNAGSNPDQDVLHIQISNNGGTSWVSLEEVPHTEAHWTQVTLNVKSFLTLTANMRFQIIAEDLNPGSVVEAAFDDFMIFEAPSTSSPLPMARTALRGAVPNPFNPSTQVHFELGTAGPATLRVYDPAGRVVRTLWTGALPAGPHAVAWDGRDALGRRVASGTYLVRLDATDFSASRRMLLVK